MKNAYYGFSVATHYLYTMFTSTYSFTITIASSKVRALKTLCDIIKA